MYSKPELPKRSAIYDERISEISVRTVQYRTVQTYNTFITRKEILFVEDRYSVRSSNVQYGTVQ